MECFPSNLHEDAGEVRQGLQRNVLLIMCQGVKHEKTGYFGKFWKPWVLPGRYFDNPGARLAQFDDPSGAKASTIEVTEELKGDIFSVSVVSEGNGR